MQRHCEQSADIFNEGPKGACVMQAEVVPATHKLSAKMAEVWLGHGRGPFPATLSHLLPFGTCSSLTPPSQVVP